MDKHDKQYRRTIPADAAHKNSLAVNAIAGTVFLFLLPLFWAVSPGRSREAGAGLS